MPMMPPARKMVVEKSTARRGRRAPRAARAATNRKAITTVAKTSKKPSTHRCTTHQRQYSTDREVGCAARTSARRRRTAAMATLGDARRGPAAAGSRPGCCSAGQQRAAHQAEPDEQADEEEDLPEAAQIHVLVALVAEPEPGVPAAAAAGTLSHWPASEPTTMTSRQTKSTFTPSALALRLDAADRRAPRRGRSRATRWRSRRCRAACARCASPRRAATSASGMP